MWRLCSNPMANLPSIIINLFPFVDFRDGDGILDIFDNCESNPNSDQSDNDMDGTGESIQTFNNETEISGLTFFHIYCRSCFWP